MIILWTIQNVHKLNDAKKSAVGAGLSLRAGAWFSPATFYEHGPWLL